MFFKKGLKDVVICGLCPHNCIINACENGVCGTRFNHDGQLITANYGKITSLHPDPIEKKPLFHFFPGRKLLSIGSFGCNMRCDFCQNHNTAQAHNSIFAQYREYKPAEIIHKMDEMKGNIGIAYTYNEPIVWYEYMFVLSKMAKENSLKNVMVSNGFINPYPLQKLCGVVDAFNIDLKSFDPGFYTSITGSELAPVLESLKTISLSGKHLEITFLVIPNQNCNKVSFLEMVKWINGELGSEIPLHINRYFPNHKRTTPQTPFNTLLDLFEVAKQHLAHVYIGNVVGSADFANTYCPTCKRLIIERNGISSEIRNADSSGRCTKCKHQVFINS